MGEESIQFEGNPTKLLHYYSVSAGPEVYHRLYLCLTALTGGHGLQTGPD